jgi:hypothetical protein
VTNAEASRLLAATPIQNSNVERHTTLALDPGCLKEGQNCRY